MNLADLGRRGGGGAQGATEAPAAGHLIEARGLVKDYEPEMRGRSPHRVLKDVSFEARGSELVAIVGPSGSGKSTLLYCLSGLERTTAGTVSLCGTDISQAPPPVVSAVRRDHVGFVFQQFNLIESLSARDNAMLPAILARRADVDEHVDKVLAELGLLELAQSRPRHMSGGEQQRLALARVLLNQPDVIFADEPTGALDSATGARVMALLRQVASQGAAVVMVTHDLDLASQADRVYVLFDGTVASVLERPTSAQLFSVMERLRAAQQ